MKVSQLAPKVKRMTTPRVRLGSEAGARLGRGSRIVNVALSVFGASGLVNTPLPRSFLVIASEAIETDINPAYDDHEYAAHEADEERHLKNMGHEDNDFICHKTRGGIIATERLLEELPNLTYLLAFTVPIDYHTSLQGANPMTQIVLTCVKCGKSERVKTLPRTKGIGSARRVANQWL
jgi:hypothetical protein